ncbi:MAG: sigma-70 family RNA polymerase sigma factor [Gemmatimonadaceae bacterium]
MRPATMLNEGTKERGALASFEALFSALFRKHVERLTRIIDRLSGEPDLAADVVQDAFVRLYKRGSMPDDPEAWLISVALNLLRSTRSTGSRRERLLTASRGAEVLADPAPLADERVAADESRQRVREAVDRMPERARQLLLLRAEGYSYRDLAIALGLNERSVGTLLARAKESFRDCYDTATPDAS